MEENNKVKVEVNKIEKRKINNIKSLLFRKINKI